MAYILSSCSTADISEEHFKARDIKYVPFHFSIDGEVFTDDLGKSMSMEDMYDSMVNGAEVKTSQVNVKEFVEYFTPYLEQGLDILHVCLSSGISGVYNSACIARGELLDKYPDRKIYVLDSLEGSSGLGLLIDKLADLRDTGMGIDRLYEWGETHKLEVQHWFFTTDLTWFIKGGRVSKLSGWFGTVFNICPLLTVDKDGKLAARFKVKGKDKVIEKIVNQMELHAQGGLDYDGKCYITNSACYEDAMAVSKLIEARFPKLDGRPEINNFGPTIGCHTGPGTVALFFWGDKRVD